MVMLGKGLGVFYNTSIQTFGVGYKGMVWDTKKGEGEEEEGSTLMQ